MFCHKHRHLKERFKVAYTITEVCVGCSACAEKCPTKSITGMEGSVHSIAPESCIECGACGKVCPNQAILDSMGSVALWVEPTPWPKPIFDRTACISCNMCIQACPVTCLSLSETRTKGLHKLPDMENPALCIACGFCAEDCPVDAIEMKCE